MRRISGWLANPTVQVRLWGALTVVWLAMTPVTMLTVLANQVSWVSFMSLFANSASCGTAWVAAMAYHRARRVDDANMHSRLDTHSEALAEVHRTVRRTHEVVSQRTTPAAQELAAVVSQQLATHHDRLIDVVRRTLKEET